MWQIVFQQMLRYILDITTIPRIRGSMTDKDFTLGSIRRIAQQIVDLSDQKRKSVLRTFPSDLKCKIVEEMVNIRLKRIKESRGSIQPPAKVSER